MKNLRLYSEWPQSHPDFIIQEWREYLHNEKHYLDFVIEKSSGRIKQNGEETTKKLFFIKAKYIWKWDDFEANCFLLAGWEYTKPTIIFDYWKINK